MLTLVTGEGSVCQVLSESHTHPFSSLFALEGLCRPRVSGERRGGPPPEAEYGKHYLGFFGMGDLSIFVYLFIQSCIYVSVAQRVTRLVYSLGYNPWLSISVAGVVQPRSHGELFLSTLTSSLVMPFG